MVKLIDKNGKIVEHKVGDKIPRGSSEQARDNNGRFISGTVRKNTDKAVAVDWESADKDVIRSKTSGELINWFYAELLPEIDPKVKAKPPVILFKVIGAM